MHHHLDQVNYFTDLLKYYELNRSPRPIGHAWEHFKEKCRPVRYAIQATDDVLQSQQLQALSGNDDDNGSNGEYGHNSDDCDIDSK